MVLPHCILEQSLDCWGTSRTFYRFSLWDLPEYTLWWQKFHGEVSHWRHFVAKPKVEVQQEAVGHRMFRPVCSGRFLMLKRLWMHWGSQVCTGGTGAGSCISAQPTPRNQEAKKVLFSWMSPSHPLLTEFSMVLAGKGKGIKRDHIHFHRAGRKDEFKANVANSKDWNENFFFPHFSVSLSSGVVSL